MLERISIDGILTIMGDFRKVIIDIGESRNYLPVLGDFCHIKFGWH